jgi:hypothetical protein
MSGYSANVSSGKEAIKSSGKLANVSKHVGRDFVTKQNRYDKKENVVLVGTGNVHADVKDAYERLFGAAVREYDNKQKRADRKIGDYFTHLSEMPYSKQKQDIAVSVILQCCDMEFWKDKTPEEKRRYDYIARDQIKHLRDKLPDFEIVSATIHYDESSPHMHVVGIPIRRGCKKGMSVQVSKNTVLTRDVMRDVFQGSLRERAEKGMRMNYKGFEGFDAKVTSYEKRKQGVLYNPENKHATPTEYKARKAAEELRNAKSEGVNEIISKHTRSMSEFRKLKALCEEQIDVVREKEETGLRERQAEAPPEAQNRPVSDFGDVNHKEVPLAGAQYKTSPLREHKKDCQSFPTPGEFAAKALTLASVQTYPDYTVELEFKDNDGVEYYCCQNFARHNRFLRSIYLGQGYGFALPTDVIVDGSIDSVGDDGIPVISVEAIDHVPPAQKEKAIPATYAPAPVHDAPAAHARTREKDYGMGR